MEYEDATTRFSHAVTELRRKMGVLAKEAYERLDRAANEARAKSEQADWRLTSISQLTAARGFAVFQNIPWPSQ